MRTDYKADEWRRGIATLTVLALFGYLTPLRVINRSPVNDTPPREARLDPPPFGRGPDECRGLS